LAFTDGTVEFRDKKLFSSVVDLRNELFRFRSGTKDISIFF
jgi:hypothetical protein